MRVGSRDRLQGFFPACLCCGRPTTSTPLSTCWNAEKMSLQTQRVIVLDNGGCTIKTGFADDPDDVRYTLIKHMQLRKVPSVSAHR